MNKQQALNEHSAFKIRIREVERKGGRKDRGGTGRETMGVSLFKTHCMYEIFKQ